MFNRRKPTPEPEPVAAAPEKAGGKGRPTPKRRDQEAANRRPLVQNSKALNAEQKAQRRLDREQARQGMLRGEQKYLPPRDAGPQKRYLRDLVDARWNIGEFLLPLMLIVLAVMILGGSNPEVQVLILPLVYGVMFVGIFDAWLLARRAKRRIREEFGVEPPRGTAMYVALRSLQMRMSRVPRPQVSRGAPVVVRR